MIKKRVVYVKHNVKPDAEPHEKYAPPVPAKYVLEVKAGVAKQASATVWVTGKILIWRKDK